MCSQLCSKNIGQIRYEGKQPLVAETFSLFIPALIDTVRVDQQNITLLQGIFKHIIAGIVLKPQGRIAFSSCLGQAVAD